MKGWLIVRCDEDWFGLYEHWMQRQAGGLWVRDRHGKLQWKNHGLQRPALGPHISVIRSDKRCRGRRWRRLGGRRVQFWFDPDLADNSDHITDGRHYFWLWVRCPELEEVRNSFGLAPQPPQSKHRQRHGVEDARAPFHLTLGTRI